MRKIHLALVAFGLIAVSAYPLAQQASAPAAAVPPNLPEWAWGVMPPAPPPQPGAAAAQPPADDGAVLHIEGSSVGLTRTQIRGIPTILMGFGLPDDGLHSPNEKYKIENYYLGIRTVARCLEEYGA